jgi:hypothetical protein
VESSDPSAAEAGPAAANFRDHAANPTSLSDDDGISCRLCTDKQVPNTRSPTNWIQKLRTYGKKIRDTTTALGHIIWSDDGEELGYMGLELSMTGFKDFVLQQVKIAEAQLYGLLYACGDEGSACIDRMSEEVF